MVSRFLGIILLLMAMTTPLSAVANTIPTSVPQSVRLAEDTSKEIVLVGYDVEDRANVFYEISTSATTLKGTLTPVANKPATFLYIPNPNSHGAASFRFRVRDSSNAWSAYATVSILVDSVPDAPTATPQTLSLAEDTTRSITLSATDPDSPLSSLRYAIARLPSNGVLRSGTRTLVANDIGVLLSSATLTYVPNRDYAGADGFTFTANDGGLTSVAATVSLTITPVNDAPTAQSQTEARAVRTDEDVPIQITLAGSDPEDGNNVTYQLGSTSSLNGTLQVLTGQTYLYTPRLNYNGTASFTFTVRDTAGLTSAPATVLINIAAIPDAPTATPQTLSLAEDTTRSITLSATDPDSPVSGLRYAIARLPSNGVLRSGTRTLVANDIGVLLSSAALTYVPNRDYAGADGFTFTANDGGLTSVAATVSLTITPVNDAPVADTDRRVTVPPRQMSIITLTGSDVDGDSLRYSLATGSPATTGTTVRPTGFGTVFGVNTLEYTPRAGATSDVIWFKVSDGKLTSTNTGKLTITIADSVNQRPTAAAGADITVVEGEAVTLVGSGTDPDGDVLSFKWLQGGTVRATTARYAFNAPSVTADQTFTYTLEVSDGKGGVATDDVNVLVKNFVFDAAHWSRCFTTGFPSEASLRALTTFTCNGIDLSTADLTQLAQLPNLRTLDLSHTKLTNISGLAGLTQLTNLNLGFNTITNISALAGMTQLQTLNLSFNAISDISALTGMNKLQALYLDANNLTTISALANKPALTKLYLDANQLTTITPLASSPNLTELGLSHNQLSTITTLSGMSALQMLALDGNNLSTISALSGLSRLQTLYLRGNLLSNVAAISGLANLKTLELGFNTISTLPSLSSLTALQHVGLEHNALTDITALSGKTSLKSVFLEHNEIPSNTATINTLQTLTGLNTLVRLEHNRLLDVNGLTTLGGSNNLALTLEDNCLGSVSLPSRIKVVGRSWQFLASRCSTAGVNNAPIAYDKISAITQGTTAVITLDAVDPDSGDTLTYALSDVNVSNGTLNTSNLSNGSVSFTASATHVGSAGSFKFRVTDNGGLQSSLATITLQISKPPPSVTDALLVQHCFGGSTPSESALVATSTLNCTSGGNLVAANFADLSDLPNLTELSMENASLTNTDLAALAQALPNLTKLTLSGNQISDVSGLIGMRQLRTLLLDNNQLTDLSGLTTQNFPALIRLNVSGNNFDGADFTALSNNLPNLIMLFLDNSQLDNADLTALFGTAAAPKLSSMYYLVLRNNGITSIEPLLHLAGVSTLLLDGNNIMDIAALSPAAPAALPMPGMSELSVNANRLSSIAVPRLGSLSLLSANRNCLSSAPLTHTNSPPPSVSWTSQRPLVSGVCPVAPQ